MINCAQEVGPPYLNSQRSPKCLTSPSPSTIHIIYSPPSLLPETYPVNIFGYPSLLRHSETLPPPQKNPNRDTTLWVLLPSWSFKALRKCSKDSSLVLEICCWRDSVWMEWYEWMGGWGRFVAFFKFLEDIFGESDFLLVSSWDGRGSMSSWGWGFLSGRSCKSEVPLESLTTRGHYDHYVWNGCSEDVFQLTYYCSLLVVPLILDAYSRWLTSIVEGMDSPISQVICCSCPILGSTTQINLRVGNT